MGRVGLVKRGALREHMANAFARLISRVDRAHTDSGDRRHPQTAPARRFSSRDRSWSTRESFKAVTAPATLESNRGERVRLM